VRVTALNSSQHREHSRYLLVLRFLPDRRSDGDATHLRNSNLVLFRTADGAIMHASKWPLNRSTTFTLSV
jgi:hypothetical protein